MFTIQKHNVYSFFFGVFVVVILRPTREFFTHGNVTITNERLQILTYSWHSWPLSSEGFLNMPHLLWHRSTIYKPNHDTGTCCLKLGCGAVATYFNDLVLLRSGQNPDLPHARQTFYHWAIGAFNVYSTDSEV